MLSFKKISHFFMPVVILITLKACSFKPLYNPSSFEDKIKGAFIQKDEINFSAITIKNVSDRIAQQIRNHLLFLFSGGEPSQSKQYEMTLQVISSKNNFLVEPNKKDTTVARVKVTAGYVLKKIDTNEEFGKGERSAIASYDLSPQNFSNLRAERDAQNRAAKEVAELLRFSVVTHLNKQTTGE